MSFRHRALIVPAVFDAQIAELDRDIAALMKHQELLKDLEFVARNAEQKIAHITADVEPVSFEDALTTCDQQIQALITKRDRLDAELHGEPAY